MTKEDVRQAMEEAEEFTVEAPIPLDEPDLPDFPKDALPGWLGDMVNAGSAATETPLELATLIGLSAVAACVHHRFVVESKPGHEEGLNIWVCPALESGNRKSAVLKEMTQPLVEWEKGQVAEMGAEIREAESKRKMEEKRIEHLRNKAAKEDDAIQREIYQRDVLEIEKNLTEIPKAPRLWVEDITPEKLGELMFDAGGSLSIVSDEGGIFDLMAGRYSNGVPNLDIFLKGHSNSPIRVDRTTRPSIFIPRPALTLALSPQPEVLRSLASKPGFRGRGLLARFLYGLPHSTLGWRNLDSQSVPASVRNRYRKQLFALLDTPSPPDLGRYVLRFSDAAYEEWVKFSRAVEVELREGGEFQFVTDWAGKLPGAAARIAGLMYCAEYAGESPWEHEISSSSMAQA